MRAPSLQTPEEVRPLHVDRRGSTKAGPPEELIDQAPDTSPADRGRTSPHLHRRYHQGGQRCLGCRADGGRAHAEGPTSGLLHQQGPI